MTIRAVTDAHTRFSLRAHGYYVGGLAGFYCQSHQVSFSSRQRWLLENDT
eukprot:SAG31_NODE_29175_length_399_cov_1.296667_1_plen_49_part_10